MEATKTVYLAGSEFMLIPIPVFERIQLDLKVARIVAPLLGSLGITSATDLSALMGSELQISQLVEGVQKALDSLDESTATNLIRKLLSRVTCVASGKSPFQLDSDSALDAAFSHDHSQVYALLLEVLKYNKIVPFGLLGTGIGIQPTGS